MSFTGTTDGTLLIEQVDAVVRVSVGGITVYQITPDELNDLSKQDCLIAGFTVVNAFALLTDFPPDKPLSPFDGHSNQLVWHAYLTMRAAWRKAHGLEAEGEK